MIKKKHKVLAFNVAEERVKVQIEGSYDPVSQQWSGAPGPTAYDTPPEMTGPRLVTTATGPMYIDTDLSPLPTAQDPCGNDSDTHSEMEYDNGDQINYC